MSKKKKAKTRRQILNEVDDNMKAYLKILDSQNERITDDKWMKCFNEELDVRLAVMREGGWKR